MAKKQEGQPPHGTGDEGLAIDLEEAADRANQTEPQPNWGELATITAETNRLREAGGFDVAARAGLLIRMRNAIPSGPLWQYLVDRTAAEILRD
jgi:hypothetical protein